MADNEKNSPEVFSQLNTLTLDQNARVSFIYGDVVTNVNGIQRVLAAGDQISSTEQISVSANAVIVIELEDGSISAVVSENLSDETVQDVTTQILLTTNLDPTTVLEPTAAGGQGGVGDFFVLSRDGDGTVATAGFDTQTDNGGDDNDTLFDRTALSGDELLDTIAPTAPTVSLLSDTGSSASDLITSNGTIAVAGLEAGSLVEFSIDGVNWGTTYTPVEGSNTVFVRQTDASGNISPSSSLTFTLDTTVNTPTAQLTTDSGSSDSDSITNSSAISVGGTETGAVVEYSTDGGTTWSNSYTAVEGNNTVLVRQTDLAGNVSGNTSVNFTLDTQVAAPTVALTNDTGSSSSDLITSDGSLNITGLETGATVEYSTDGGTTWTNSFTPAEGANTVQVRQTDTAGNTSGASSISFTLDTQVAAPTVALTNDTGSSNSDLVTSDGSLNITGLETGATVEYSTDGGTTWTNSFTPAEGANTVQVRQTDTAGNTSGASSISFTLDTQVAAPSVALTNDTGSSSSDLITSDGSLNITGLETGATVEYSIDGGTTWTNSFTPAEGANTVQVRQTDTAGNTSGASSISFTLDTQVAAPTVALTNDTGSSSSDLITSDGSLNITGLETGATVEYSTDGGTTWTNSFTPAEGANTVQVRQTDTAGNTSGASSISFTLDTQVAAPTVTLTSDTGSSNSDLVTSDGSLNITGLETGATVEYSTDGGTTWTNSFTPVEGANTVQVRQTDTAGNTSGASSISFTLDTQVAAPTVALANDTGSSHSDLVTSDGSLNITGLETGATVEYSTDGGTTWTNSFTPAEGANTVQVRQTDTAGNTSGASSISFTMDTQVAAPTVALTNDTGSSNSDLVTSDGSLNITGLETGATVEYSIDGGTTWTNSFTPAEGANTVQVRQTDTAGNTSGASSISFTLDTQVAAPTVALTNDTGSSSSDLVTSDGSLNITGLETGATVEYSTDGGTTWTNSFTPAEGANTVQVRQTDTAGNTSGASSISFTLDTQVAAPTVALTNDTGSSSSDLITSDGSLNITGLEIGATVEYSTDGGTTWTNSFTPAEGANTVQVRQTDTAGNTSGASSISFTLDTQVAAPTVALTNDTGSSSSDLITSDGSLNITGLETGATVEYSTDGGTTWTNSFTPAEGANTVQVRQTDTAGNTSGASSISFTLDTQVAAPTVALTNDTGSSNSDLVTSDGSLNITGLETGATVEYSTDGGTTWTNSFTQAEGANTVQVRQTDTAGNVSGASSISFTLDTQVAAPTIALTNDTGSSSSDLITSDGALSIGNVETGATVEYSTDGGTTWTNSFTPAEGANTVQVRQTDTAGNVSGASFISFTLDTLVAAPTVALTNDTGSSNSDLITSDGALSIGNVETGATVEYSTDGGTTWTNSFTPAEGSNTVQVRQTDTAGNTSGASSISFTLDTQVAAPTVSLTNDTGSSNSDLITSDGSLNITGLETGATVEYSTDGGTTWTSSFTPAEGANTVQVRQTDTAGNTSGASSISFTLDTQVAAPTVALTNDTGSSGSDLITSDGSLNITGLETGATVEYSTDGGTTWTNSFTPAEGSNTVQVRQTDTAGNVSGASSISFTLDTQVAAPTVTLTNDTGSSNSDLVTSDGSLNITGFETGATVEYFTDGGTTWTNSFTPAEGANTVQVRQTDTAGNISGASSISFTLDTQVVAPTVALTNDTGSSNSDLVTSDGSLNITGLETGATVEYSTDGGATWTNSFTPAEGANTVQVRQTDTAGNVSGASSISFTLDTQVAAPTIALTNDTGSSSSDLVTSDGALSIGNLETGATVEYSTDGGTTWTSSFTPAEGANTIQVRQTDIAGNTSGASSISFTLDTQVSAPTVALTNDTGSSNSDLITSDGALSIGNLETGAMVEYSTDGGTTWTNSFTPAEGANTVQVRQTDTAGNTSGASSISFTLDTQVAAPTVVLTNDTGSSSSDNITSDGSLNITGLETGATVEYSTDGGTTWTNSFTPAEGANTVQVRQTDTAGNTSGASSISFTLDTQVAAPTVALTNDTGSSSSDLITSDGLLNITGLETGATVEYSIDGGTTWTNSFTPAEGANTVQVRQTDTAGNTSGVSSISFTLDTQVAAPTVALTNDTGSSNSDLISSDGSLNITGLETGATVEYSIDGGTTWTNSFTPAEGSNTVQVRQTDTAGNTSGASSISFTLDTQVTAPTIALANDTGSSSSDLITSDGALAIGGLETGATVEYSIDGGSTWTNSFTPVEGANTVQIRQTDTAGNVSGASSISFTLDTQVAAPTVALTNDTGSSSSDLVTSDGSLNITGLETGATVEYSIDGGTTWTNSFTPAEGTNTVQVRQTDTAGNTSGASSISFTLDTQVAAPTVALTNDTGSSNSDLVTSDGALSIGNVETGATVEYSTDGGTTWTSSFTPSEGSNTVQIRQTDTAGNTSGASSISFTLDTQVAAPTVALTNDTGSSSSDLITSDGTLSIGNVETGATVEYSTDGGTTWTNSFTPAEGANTVQVRQTDTAGNTSGASSISFTLDTQVAAPTVALTNDTGSSNSDLVTSDGALSIGNVETGATVEYSTDGGTTWTSSFTPSEGSNTVQIRQTDTAGNTSGASSISFSLDTQVAAPTVALTNDTGSSGSDLITSDGSLNITGLETGATVEYSTDGGTTWTNTFTPAEGANTVQVRQTDTAGNTSGASSISFTLDTQVAAPTVALTNDTGSSSSDLITSDGSLNITGLETGATVEYSTDGGTTWTNSFTPAEGANTVQVRQTDTAGNTSGASSISFTLDTQVAAPTVALTNDTGSSNSDLVTSDGSLNITGLETGATVEYSTDGGTTWTNSFTPAEGANTVQVRQTDTAGNTSGASSISFTLDTQVAVPTVALTNDTGSSSSDLITSDGSLNITGLETGATVEYSTDGGTTWTNSFTPAEGANTVQVRQTDTAGNVSGASSISFTLDTQVAAPTVALTNDTGSSSSDLVTSNGALSIGNVETGATVEYSTDGGNTWTNSFTPAEGANTVQVRQTDTAGNTSGASSISFTLDTQVAAPTVALTNDTGTSSSDLITSDGALSIGNLETGATIEYSTDGGTTWTNSFTPAEGANTVQVRQTDTAGNTSGASSISFTLDTQVAAPTVALTNDTGSSSSDNITSDGSLNITGLETGATVEYSTDGGTTWTNSFTPAEGANTVQVRQTDTAGNTSGASSISFTLDTQVAAPTVALTNDTGTSSSDLITSDGSLNITGLETGATVEYSTDGGTTWTNSFTPTEGVNTVQVRQTDTAGNTSGASSISFTLDTQVAAPTVALANDTGSSNSDLVTSDGSLNITGLETGATVEYSTDGGTTWTNSFTPAEGANTVQVRQTDTAGNTSGASSISFTLDTQVTAPTVALTNDTGSSNSDNITSDGSLNITGLETGATVEYSIDGGTTWTSSFTPAEGANTVQVRQTDTAGNTSGASSISFTLDTQVAAPTVALTNDTGSSSSDLITSDGSLNITGLETGATVEYSIDGGTTWTNSFTPAEGLNTVQVRQTDTAGNTSDASSISFTLDTQVAAPTVSLTNDTGSSNSDLVTSDGSLNITGLETGATVEYSTDGGTTWTNSFTPAEGANTVEVRQTDTAGNTSGASSISFTLDTQVAAPTVTLTNDTGSSNSDLVTSEGSLNITGLETGSTVEYSTDGGTTWTNSFTPAEGANTVQVRQTDTAGNVSGASSISFTLDTQVAAPIIALTNDTGSSSSDLITSDGALSISNVETGATVEYSTDGGTTWTNSFTPTEGSNTVQVRQTDTAGNTSGASSISFTLDTQVAAPTVALTNDTGSSNSDLVTSDGSLNITGLETGATVEYSTDGGTTWTNSFTPAEGSNTVQVRQTDTAGNTSGASSISFTLDTQVAAPTVSLNNDTGSSSSDLITSDGALSIGNVETGATVEYSTDGGTTWTNSFTPAEGANTVQVRQTDTAGNTSGVSSISFTLDTQVAAPTVGLTNDTGSSSSDLITSDGSLNITGLETGAIVEYSTDGGTTWTNSFTPAEGANSVQIRQTDTAGNTSGASSISFTLDTQVSAPTVALTNDTGSSSSDLITSDGSLNITGLETGATVEYSTDGGTTWTNSFTPAEGVNTVQVRQTDTAGNVSGASSISFTLDTQVAAPTVALTNDTGSSNSDLVTSDGALSIGNVETGATVEYSIDGGTTWTNSFTPAEGANTVQVRQTDTAGNVSGSSSISFTLDTQVAAPTVALSNDTGSSNSDNITSDGSLNITGLETGATVEYSTDGGTTWTNSFTPAEGANTVQVRQTDTAGNTSGASSISFTLDTQVAAPTVALTNDTGSSNSDLVTSDGSLSIGNVETGANVEYSTDGGTTWTNSFTPAEGANTVQVRQTDTAGNTSGASSISFTLDTQVAAPTVALTNDTGSSSSDLITSDGSLNITGLETGATVEYSIDGGTTWTSSYTPAEGANTVQVRQTDTAGNTSGASSISFTLDTQVAAPTVALTNDTGSSSSDLITSDGALSIGNVETGATVEYSTDGGTTWTDSFTPAEGANTVQVRQTDIAGNTSGTSSISFTLDTTSPQAPTVVISEDTNNNGIITNNELSGLIDVLVTPPAGAQVGDILKVSGQADVVLSASDISGGVSYQYPVPSTGSTLNVSAVLEDQAGNTSAIGTDSARVNAPPQNQSFSALLSNSGTTSINFTNHVSDSEDDSSATASTHVVITSLPQQGSLTGILIDVNGNPTTRVPITSTHVSNGQTFDLSSIEYQEPPISSSNFFIGSDVSATGSLSDWGSYNPTTKLITNSDIGLEISIVQGNGVQDGLQQYASTTGHIGTGLGDDSNDSGINRDETLTLEFGNNGKNLPTEVKVGLDGMGGHFSSNASQNAKATVVITYGDGSQSQTFTFQRQGGDSREITIGDGPQFNINTQGLSIKSIDFGTQSNSSGSTWVLQYVGTEIQQTVPDSFEYQAIDSDGDTSGTSSSVTLVEDQLQIALLNDANNDGNLYGDTELNGNTSLDVRVYLNQAAVAGNSLDLNFQSSPVTLTQTDIDRGWVDFTRSIPSTDGSQVVVTAQLMQGNTTLTDIVSDDAIFYNFAPAAPTLSSMGAAVTSDEGLANANTDVNSASNESTASFIIRDVNVGDTITAQFAVNNGSPVFDGGTPSLKSGGEDVVWSVQNGTLVGTLSGTSTKVIEVTITAPSSQGITDRQFDYTVKQYLPLDHSDSTTENEQLTLTPSLTVSDGNNQINVALDIAVEDDSPTSSNIVNSTAEAAPTNIQFVIDISGSMNNSSASWLTWTQNAISNLLTNFAVGEAKVQIVAFNGAIVMDTGWLDPADATTQVNTLTDSGWTEYQYGLQAASSAWSKSGQLDNANNMSFFISDGEPTSNSNYQQEINTWLSTVSENNILSQALGVGTPTSDGVTALNHIAFDGHLNRDIDFTLVASSATLNETIASAEQNLEMISGQIPLSAGADGLKTFSITWGTSEYEFNVADQQFYKDGDTSKPLGLQVLLFTAAGEQFLVKSDGSYTFKFANRDINAKTIDVSFEITDQDGDSSTSTLSITKPALSTVNHIETYAGNDAIYLNGTPQLALISNSVKVDTTIYDQATYGSDWRLDAAANIAENTSDTVYSGAGNDHVEAGLGDDIVYLGDSGNNSASLDDGVTFTFLDDSSVYQGPNATEDSTLLASAASTSWGDVAQGAQGNDIIFGEAGHDLISGGSGNDYLDGGTDSDFIRGGSGTDTIIGGSGNDYMRGDLGSDLFVWDSQHVDASGATDKIYDFDADQDTLSLNGLLKASYDNISATYFSETDAGYGLSGIKLTITDVNNGQQEILLNNVGTSGNGVVLNTLIDGDIKQMVITDNSAGITIGEILDIEIKDLDV